VNHEKAVLQQRIRRSFRVRKSVRGTAERPRLSVFRSRQQIYCQVIDDSTGRTLVAASTREKAFGGSYGGNVAAATAIGKLVAERALANGIERVCFDRGAYRYHGRVAAVADAAREAGLQL